MLFFFHRSTELKCLQRSSRPILSFLQMRKLSCRGLAQSHSEQTNIRDLSHPLLYMAMIEMIVGGKRRTCVFLLQAWPSKLRVKSLHQSVATLGQKRDVELEDNTSLYLLVEHLAPPPNSSGWSDAETARGVSQSCGTAEGKSQALRSKRGGSGAVLYSNMNGGRAWKSADREGCLWHISAGSYRHFVWNCLARCSICTISTLPHQMPMSP